MTIMFYINTIHTGGAERVITQLANHFAERGNHSILVTSYYDNNEYEVSSKVIRESLETKEVKTTVIKRNISRIVKLRNLCKSLKPSVLVSFMPEPCFRAIVSTLGLPIVNIVSVRNDPRVHYKGLVGLFLGKVIMPLANGCVFQTEEQQKWFPKSLQYKSKIIFNDVSSVFFSTDYYGGNDIVSLGRLVPQKNHELLIRAFSLIANNHLEVNLRIYGKGELEDHLNKIIEDLNLKDRVFLEGITNDVSSILSKANMFILTSDYEGMPNSLMEALALGVPSICTDCPCGGPRMLIKNGVNGFLIPVGDLKATADAMNYILDNAEDAKIISRKAKEYSKEYETKKIVDDWEDYILDIKNNRYKAN